jgi:hypothetical protein
MRGAMMKWGKRSRALSDGNVTHRVGAWLRLIRPTIAVVAATAALFSATGAYGSDRVLTSSPASPTAKLTAASVTDAIVESGNAPAAGGFSDSGDVISTATRTGEVTVEDGTDAEVKVASGNTSLSIGLPVGGEAQVHNGYAMIFSSGATTSLSVGSTSPGAVQVLATLSSPEAPTTYAFPVRVRPGASLKVASDGGAVITDGVREMARFDPPWAVDAKGTAVPTRYVVAGSTLTQVVDHRSADFAYPVVADPSVRPCNWWTAACFKFSNLEVRRINASWATGAGAGIATACSLIPWSPWYAGAVKVVCVVTVAAKASEFVAAIRSAQASGSCVEVKWSIVATPFISGTKVAAC